MASGWIKGIGVGALAGAALAWGWMRLADPTESVPPADAAAPAGSAAPGTPAIAPGVLQAIHERTRGFERTFALHALLRGADADALDALLAEADALRPRRIGDAAKALVYARYAAVDAPRALARINSSGFHELRHLEHLFRAWAQHDADAAVAAAEALQPAQRRRAGAAILEAGEGLSAARRHAIAEALSALPTLAWLRAEDLLDADPQRAWDDALAGEPGPSRDALLRAVALHWVERDPLHALAALDELADQAPAALRAELVSRWAGSDPGAATRYLLLRGESPQRRALVVDAVGAIAEDSALDALQFAAYFDGAEYAAAAAQALFIWGERDPQAALTTLAGLGEPALERQLGPHLARRWAQRDPDAAFDWAAAQPPSRQRSSLLAEPLEAIARNDPRRALALAEAQVRGADRGRVVERILAEWARADQRDAAHWAAFDAQSADAADADGSQEMPRRRALTAVLRIWAAEDADGAMRWLLAQPLAIRRAAAAALVADVARRSPQQAARLAERFRDRQARRQARIELVAAWAAVAPLEAVRWAMRVAGGQQRIELYEHAFAAWGEFDLQGAADHARRLRAGRERDSVRAVLVPIALAADGELAEELYRRIGYEPARQRAARELFLHWRDLHDARADDYRAVAGFAGQEGDAQEDLPE